MTETQRRYYLANREKIIARQKEYNARHKDEKREYDFKRKQQIWKEKGRIMGVRRGNKCIYVSRLPERKRLCLVCEEGNVGTIVATFRSEEEVKMFEEYLNYICFGKEKVEE